MDRQVIVGRRTTTPSAVTLPSAVNTVADGEDRIVVVAQRAQPPADICLGFEDHRRGAAPVATLI